MSIALPTSSSSLFLIEVLIYVARQQVVFKMDRHGNGDELLLDNVFESRNCTPSFRNFNQELFIGEISKTPKTSFSFCFFVMIVALLLFHCNLNYISTFHEKNNSFIVLLRH